MFVLCDINSAYVSFCQLFNPQFNFKTTPLAVLSSNQGNVVARNDAVKSLGIKMGEAAFKAMPIIQQNHGHAWGSNFALFADLSNRFHTELQPYLINHFAYSVDEAFGEIHFETTEKLKNHAKLIKATLQKNLGLGVGVGISKTKTLAKLASHWAKIPEHRDKTGGTVVLDTDEKIDWALVRTEINEIWNVGRKTSKKLNELGVYNGLQLKNFGVARAKKLFTVTVARTIEELNGISAIELNDLNAERGRICVSRSMGKHVTDKNELRAALSSHAVTAAAKLRKFKLFASSLIVFINTDGFRKEHAQYHKSIQIKLPQHTSDTEVILKYAMFALDNIYKGGYKYKKTGIILENFLHSSDHQQLNLFEETSSLKSSKCTKVADEINKKFGSGAIKFGSQGFLTGWKPKDDMAPQSYTTCLAELPVANA